MVNKVAGGCNLLYAQKNIRKKLKNVQKFKKFLFIFIAKFDKMFLGQSYSCMQMLKTGGQVFFLFSKRGLF